MSEYLNMLREDGILKEVEALLERSGLTISQLRDRLRTGALRDLLDPLAVVQAGTLRNPLHLNEVVTRKSWELEIHHHLQLETRLSNMVEQCKKVKLGMFGPKLIWSGFSELYNWANRLPANDQVGVNHVTCETLRFKEGVRKERILIEMEEMGVKFADHNHLIDFTTRYIKHLCSKKGRGWGRNIFITRPEYFDGHDSFCTDYLELRWTAADVVGIRNHTGKVRTTDTRVRFYTPFMDSDLLVVRK